MNWLAICRHTVYRKFKSKSKIKLNDKQTTLSILSLYTSRVRHLINTYYLHRKWNILFWTCLHKNRLPYYTQSCSVYHINWFDRDKIVKDMTSGRVYTRWMRVSDHCVTVTSISLTIIKDWWPSVMHHCAPCFLLLWPKTTRTHC